MTKPFNARNIYIKYNMSREVKNLYRLSLYIYIYTHIYTNTHHRATSTAVTGYILFDVYCGWP